MEEFKNVDLGKLDNIKDNYENGKVFLHDKLNLTSCEISVSAMSGGTHIPFNHRHKQNEEVYIFLKGEGVLKLDGEQIPVKEGSCVKIAPSVSRILESKTDIRYICVQAKAGSLEQFGMGDGELC